LLTFSLCTLEDCFWTWRGEKWKISNKQIV
jgi:hypothetical protein